MREYVYQNDFSSFINCRLHARTNTYSETSNKVSREVEANTKLFTEQQLNARNAICSILTYVQSLKNVKNRSFRSSVANRSKFNRKLRNTLVRNISKVVSGQSSIVGKPKL